MQLEGIDTDLRFDEVGTVLEVSDGVARIYGLENAEANELLVFTVLTMQCRENFWSSRAKYTEWY